MAARTGHAKAGGRKKGTPNRVTSDLRSWVQLFIDENRKQFESDMCRLTPDQRVNVMCKLLEYVLPKVKEDINVTEMDDDIVVITFGGE